jgi:hypothetical protein
VLRPDRTGQVDARSTELAVRLALGANRRRLTQQLLVEAVLIAAAAGTFGAVFALGGFRVLARALPLGAWAEVSAPDWTLFAAAMGIAVGAALVVAIVPAASLWRGDLRATLGTTRTGGLEGRGGRLENGLVVAEVALAVLIASSAALLARSVVNLYAVEPDVRTESVAVVDVTIGAGSRARQLQTLEQLIESLAELPGIRTASSTQTLPLQGGGYNMPLSIRGLADVQGMTTEYRIVSPGYLEVMGFELRDGRTITQADRIDTVRVVVINQAFADRHFAGINPIGQQIGALLATGVMAALWPALRAGMVDPAITLRAE